MSNKVKELLEDREKMFNVYFKYATIKEILESERENSDIFSNKEFYATYIKMNIGLDGITNTKLVPTKVKFSDLSKIKDLTFDNLFVEKLEVPKDVEISDIAILKSEFLAYKYLYESFTKQEYTFNEKFKRTFTESVIDLQTDMRLHE